MLNHKNTCAKPQGGFLREKARNWLSAEDGAVTVDWVVLTATMAVIGSVIVTMTVSGTTDVGNQIQTVLIEKNASE